MKMHAIRLQILKEKIADFPTLVAFARHYELDTAYISQLLNGHRSIGERAARNLENKIGWPAMHMDRMLVLSAEEQFEASLAPINFKPSVHKTYAEVPLISHVQAGLWTESVNSYEPGSGKDFLPTHIGLGPDAFALTIRGESMLPEFREDDIVIIDPGVFPGPGDFVVASNDQHEATFKKYRPRGVDANGETVIELVPLNDDFPILRSDRSPFRIIGTMIEHRRFRKAK